LYWALLARLVLVMVVYGALAGHAIGGFGWAGDAACWAAIVVISEHIVCFPLDFWRSYLRERRWEPSTQRLGGWVGDRAKGLAVTLVLAGAGWTALVAVARALPSAPGCVWRRVDGAVPVAACSGSKRLNSGSDKQLARALRELAEQAGVPVRNVLVADASRRTVKSNAYVSGLGPTRRVVVWDTLLGARVSGS
jgi:STE24 endopeptidase